MNNKLKLLLAGLMVLLFIAVAPSFAANHYANVLNNTPKLADYTKFEKMPYNLFNELQKQFPKRPANYQEVKFKIIDEVIKYKGQGDIHKAKQAEERLQTDPVLNGRYLDEVINDNWKDKGYFQKTDHFIDFPMRKQPGIGFIDNLFNPNYTIVNTPPVNLYINPQKAALFQSYFYSPENTVFVVDANGDVYKMPDDIKAHFYKIQSQREDAQKAIHFIQNNLWLL